MIDLNLPNRSVKPRDNGITMVMDTGLPLGLLEDYLDLNAHLIDYVKIGWGTSAVTSKIKEKLNIYKKYNIDVSFGGTFFELSLLQNKLDEYIAILKDYQIPYVEISDGSIDMTLEEKLRYIEDFSRDFRVLSEVGSKDIEAVVAPKKWVKEIKETLNAGAWKIITEGRESGKAGLYRQNSEIRTGLLEEILDEVELSKLIFEAPLKSQQVWLIKEYGSNVNLGNITFKDIISLETIRLGLRGDTLLHFHNIENK